MSKDGHSGGSSGTSPSGPQTAPTASQALLDIADLRHLVYPLPLHPIEALRAYFPLGYLPVIFGGKSFNPETEISDLSGKVYLVTGGTSLCFELFHAI
jgi:hypothetical protein